MVPKKSLTPFFSIITLTYNSEKYLKKCLESVKSQTFHDYEQIIIDGNSTDKTHTILRSSHLRPLLLTARGIASAMNEGIKHSKGKYLFFLNSDDSFNNSQVLAQVHDFLVSHPDHDWVYGRIHEVNESGKTIGYPPRLPIFHSPRPNLLKYYNYVPHQATFVKKSVFDQFGGFDEHLKSMMDPEYWLRISPHTKWGYMPIIVANYLIRPDSQSESEQNARYNTQEYERVQASYLSKPQMVLAKLINLLLR